MKNGSTDDLPQNVADIFTDARMRVAAAINSVQGDRAHLEKGYGQVWDTQELQRDFEVHGFAAPFVMVTRKSDGKKGCLMFQHMPRFYFYFEAD